MTDLKEEGTKAIGVGIGIGLALGITVLACFMINQGYNVYITSQVGGGE